MTVVQTYLYCSTEKKKEGNGTRPLGRKGSGAFRRGRDRDRDLGGAFRYSRRGLRLRRRGAYSPVLTHGLRVASLRSRGSCRGYLAMHTMSLQESIERFILPPEQGEVRRSRIGGGECSEPVSRIVYMSYDTESKSRNASCVPLRGRGPRSGEGCASELDS